jgi:hypothetical protein
MRFAIICIGLVLLAAQSSPSSNQFFGFQGGAGRAHFNQDPFYTKRSDVRPKQR